MDAQAAGNTLKTTPLKVTKPSPAPHSSRHHPRAHPSPKLLHEPQGPFSEIATNTSLKVLLRCFLPLPPCSTKCSPLPSPGSVRFLLTVPIPGLFFPTLAMPVPLQLQLKGFHLPPSAHLPDVRCQDRPPTPPHPQTSFRSRALPHRLLGHVLRTRSLRWAPPVFSSASPWDPSRPSCYPGFLAQLSFSSLRPNAPKHPESRLPRLPLHTQARSRPDRSRLWQVPSIPDVPSPTRSPSGPTSNPHPVGTGAGVPPDPPSFRSLPRELLQLPLAPSAEFSGPRQNPRPLSGTRRPVRSLPLPLPAGSGPVRPFSRPAGLGPSRREAPRCPRNPLRRPRTPAPSRSRPPPAPPRPSRRPLLQDGGGGGGG